MSDSPILICYDDSKGARHAIEVAAQLFSGRRAVVLDVAPPLTVAESYAAVGGVVPDFEELNTEDALARARVGAERRVLRRHGGLAVQHHPLPLSRRPARGTLDRPGGRPAWGALALGPLTSPDRALECRVRRRTLTAPGGRATVR